MVRYHKSFIILVVIALNFYIRIPGTTIRENPKLFTNALAIAWLIWPLAIFANASKLQRWAGGVFVALMSYCLIDNLYFSLKEWTDFDLYSISGILAAGAASLPFVYRKGIALNRREILSVVLLFLTAWFIIAGRNYMEHYPELFHWLGWTYNTTGGPFFNADGLAGILSCAYLIANNTSLNRRIAIVQLLYAMHNYLDETKYDPTHDTAEELGTIIVITLFSIWFVGSGLRKVLR